MFQICMEMAFDGPVCKLQDEPLLACGALSVGPSASVPQNGSVRFVALTRQVGTWDIHKYVAALEK